MGKNTGKKKKPQGGVKISSQSFRYPSNQGSLKGDAQEGLKLGSKSFRYVTEGSLKEEEEDDDTKTFVEVSQELREEGNRFFQRRDHCSALLSYQKALRLLPENHPDIAQLRTNMAACYMQMGINEYPRAINECNLALLVVPQYTKALLKRARCYMDLDRFDLALMDIDSVLECEPDNIIALDIRDTLINEITQLEAEFEDEETVVKRKKIKKKKKKNAKGEGDIVEEREVEDEVVVKKDTVVMKPDEIARPTANGEPKIQSRGMEMIEKMAETRARISKWKGVEARAVIKKEKKSETSTIMNEEKKVEPNYVTHEEKQVESRFVIHEEKQVGPRFVMHEEKKVEPRSVMVEEKKVETRSATNEETNAETRAAVHVEKKLELRAVINDVKKVETRTLKLVCGDDIRRVALPSNARILTLRDKIRNRFRSLKGVIIKYKDDEGDSITITTTEDLRMAEASADPAGSLRLYIIGVDYDAEPEYEDDEEEEEIGDPDIDISNEAQIVVKEMEGRDQEDGFGEEQEKSTEYMKEPEKISDSSEEQEERNETNHWIRQFSRLLKNHVGFDSDSNLELHEEGMRLYSEAMEDTFTNDEAHDLLGTAAKKFQEMAALASFNCGNVYMSKAKKKVSFYEDDSRDNVLEQAKTAFEWAQKQYENARMKYEEAVKIKPDFYEGYIALGYQLFEQAKLSWYYALANDFDMESGPSSDILDLYNKAEESMEKGVLIWEELEQERPSALLRPETSKLQGDKMGLNGHLRTISTDECADPASIMRSQIYVLWGSLLYERSVVEFKMGIPVWAECLEVAVEKFELAGASQTDIAVMVKNHCSNVHALEGLEFKIDEIVQAWNEMHDAKRWQLSEPSFRLEPLFRRQGPKLHEVLEHIGYSFLQD